MSTKIHKNLSNQDSDNYNIGLTQMRMMMKREDSEPYVQATTSYYLDSNAHQVSQSSNSHEKNMLKSVNIKLLNTVHSFGLLLKKYAELSAVEKIQADCDMKAANIIIQGTSLTKKERECKVYDAFDKFTHIKDESLHKYYSRFTQLINDMNIYNIKMEQFQVNTKFLNSLPPEWSKFMIDVKLVKDLHTTNFDQLHACLKQHELHANEVRLLRKRNQDPLAFMANQQMTLPYFNTYQSSYNNPQLQQQF
nr:hypothetical protein [Tanacetum cinerariifolium]